MNPFKILIMQPFGWLLRQLYLLVGNYGAALIIFSIAVKLILLPLNIKGKKSMMKMSRMSPKLKALEKKYGDDKLKYQTAVSQLYKDEGINPMGGCLWSFVPLLILWPLYYVIKDPLTYIVGLSSDQISLVQTTLTGLGVSFDGVRDYYLQVNMAGYIHEFYSELHAVIPGLMDMNFDFFGINLANQPTFAIWSIEGLTWAQLGLWLLPFLSGLANFASAMLSQKLNGSVATNDKGEVDKDAVDNQAANMKGMLYMMPLMSVWIGFSVPGGLSIYWIAQAITNFIQEFILTKHYRKVYDAEDAVKAELYAQREAEEAERERLREEKRQQNALAGNVNANTSKRKLKNQQKALEATSEEGKWSAEERAKKLEERSSDDDASGANFSGDPERPYARGRAYKPNRFGRNTMESGTPEEESRSAEEE
jgi:YidC/Oxa1 family membrane protein insertase